MPLRSSWGCQKSISYGLWTIAPLQVLEVMKCNRLNAYPPHLDTGLGTEIDTKTRLNWSHIQLFGFRLEIATCPIFHLFRKMLLAVVFLLLFDVVILRITGSYVSVKSRSLWDCETDAVTSHLRSPCSWRGEPHRGSASGMTGKCFPRLLFCW